MAVLGEAGSGKTILTLRFVLQFLDSRAADEPVPVIFSLGSWDPIATDLDAWLVERLLRDHPGLNASGPGGTTLAAAMVEARCILPVLDGFDELAEGLHSTALQELNAVPKLRLLLTSRTDQFAAVVERRPAHRVPQWSNSTASPAKTSPTTCCTRRSRPGPRNSAAAG